MSAPSRTDRRPTDADYERLLAVRDGLRRFLRWSEEQATTAGVTPAQHQLLLAIKGHGEPPSVGAVAAHLLLKHHSAVELVDRAERAGLVRRDPDPDDNRIVRLALTRQGEERLQALAAAHLEQLARLRPDVERLWAGL
jgi:DNA-binding MarR family transcriptional regulator